MNEYRELITEQMLDYLKRILEINEYINLTSIRDFDRAVMLHLEDSLSALPELEKAKCGKYADIGCGGGFPGVPLCLATKRHTTLVDSKAKKINAVRQAIEASVGTLEKFSFEASRIEDFALTHKGEFAVITARALSSLPSIMELASPLLQRGGTLIAMKANIDKAELQSAREVTSMLGFSELKMRSFLLSDSRTHRTIITFEKIDKPSIKLPRKVGLAQNSPLGSSEIK